MPASQSTTTIRTTLDASGLVRLAVPGVDLAPQLPFESDRATIEASIEATVGAAVGAGVGAEVGTTAQQRAASTHAPDAPRWDARTPRELGALWQRALAALKKLAGRSAVDTWLLKLDLVSLYPLPAAPDGKGDPGAGVQADLRAADDQVAQFVRDHHLTAIEAAMAQVLGVPVQVRAVAASGPAPLFDPAPAHRVDALGAPIGSGAVSLDPDGGFARPAASTATGLAAQVADLVERFTFERFVVGIGNELAASAAGAICQAPGVLYNPLFVHGGVGLGKTHLLHAIGHRMRALQPNLRVRYVAAETYIDDVYAAWRSKDSACRQEVRNHYRDGADVLLLDDAQFLQGNDKIGEEFFHLFNALHNAGKQIVLSSDRYPSELQGLHERLRSRMQWGLVAELSPPDRDLRIAILRHKAGELQLVLPPDVVFYLADHLCNNVRELEGALHKLSAHARMGRRSIDLGLARAALGPMIEMPSRNLTAEVIQRVTAQHFGIKVTDLKGAKRHRTVVVPRMIAMYLVRKHTSASLPDIGRLFGGRDHTTVLHGCRKMQGDVTRKPDIQVAVQAIETALGK
ncbi:MAG: chromosomal replication initiator protein DnaA [Deltaproteobacteria bacterium]|nr:chromosomal replication initiator protein DnaA [Deltaproteobacteria bacterium]